MDMGSTKLAIFLVDLESGATLAQTGVMNPQIAYGEDVVSRIAYANRDAENRMLLQSRLVETINQTLAEFCAREGVCRDQIVDAVVVGNTAMHHFFTGLPVEPLGSAPYVPVVASRCTSRPPRLGWQLAPGAWVYLPPNIAGYVGADHVAALLATQLVHRNGAHRAAGGYRHQHRDQPDPRGAGCCSCSCASGPAFEGAHIRDGMRAAPGAIERVHIRTAGGAPGDHRRASRRWAFAARAS